MKYAFLAALLCACTRNLPPEPPIVVVNVRDAGRPADAAFSTTTCGRACDSLERAHCPEVDALLDCEGSCADALDAGLLAANAIACVADADGYRTGIQTCGRFCR
jgi:hypothetical protein